MMPEPAYKFERKLGALGWVFVQWGSLLPVVAAALSAFSDSFQAALGFLLVIHA